MTEATRWLSGLDALLGAWLVISPFLLATTDGGLSAFVWNNVVIGLAIFLIAGYNYYRQSQELAPSAGSASLVALLGLWTVVAPFVVFPADATAFWNNVVTGAVVTAIAAYVAYEGREAETATPETT